MPVLGNSGAAHDEVELADRPQRSSGGREALVRKRRRHADVDQRDVRQVARDRLVQLSRVRGVRRNLHATVAQQRRYAIAHQRSVIGVATRSGRRPRPPQRTSCTVMRPARPGRLTSRASPKRRSGSPAASSRTSATPVPGPRGPAWPTDRRGPPRAPRALGPRRSHRHADRSRSPTPPRPRPRNGQPAPQCERRARDRRPRSRRSAPRSPPACCGATLICARR